MSTVADILNRAARQCSVVKPQAWVSATDTTALELLDFLDETREDIQARCDWIGPISKTTVITGSGAESYTLPLDFLRLQRDDYAVYERFRTRRPCLPVTQDGQWEYIDELGVTGAYRYYRLRGYDGNWEIDLKEPLETGLTVVVSYVSKNWLVNAGGQSDEFLADNNISLLPLRLMVAGIVWRFRRRKALQYQDVLAEYEMLMARTNTDSRTRRAINFAGGQPLRSPFDIPLPDFIPPS
jgi:hypothetical protein